MDNEKINSTYIDCAMSHIYNSSTIRKIIINYSSTYTIDIIFNTMINNEKIYSKEHAFKKALIKEIIYHVCHVDEIVNVKKIYIPILAAKICIVTNTFVPNRSRSDFI